MMKRARLLLAATILSNLALTGCAVDRPRISLPSADLAEGKPEPDAPDLPVVDWSSIETARPVQMTRDRLMLDYVLGLRSVIGECRADEDGLRAWRAKMGE